MILDYLWLNYGGDWPLFVVYSVPLINAFLLVFLNGILLEIFRVKIDSKLYEIFNFISAFSSSVLCGLTFMLLYHYYFFIVVKNLSCIIKFSYFFNSITVYYILKRFTIISMLIVLTLAYFFNIFFFLKYRSEPEIINSVLFYICLIVFFLITAISVDIFLLKLFSLSSTFWFLYLLLITIKE